MLDGVNRAVAGPSIPHPGAGEGTGKGEPLQPPQQKEENLGRWAGGQAKRRERGCGFSKGMAAEHFSPCNGDEEVVVVVMQ